MTEQEQVLAMLNRIGAKVIEATYPEEDGRVSFEVEAVNSLEYTPITGYSGFVARWTFTPEGELYQLGVWE